MRRRSTAEDVGTWVGRLLTCDGVMIEFIDREFGQVAGERWYEQETYRKPGSQATLSSLNPESQPTLLQSNSLFGKV